jgi:sporulation protein YlmC with PRC-barrel domain
VYSGPNEDAERIGDVNDVVLGPNGNADAVIIGVGGFLGIGEKDVAVDFDRVSWVDRDGDRWIIIQATKEDLEAAPTYDRSATMPNQMSSVDQNNVAPANTNNVDNNQAVVVDNNNATTTTTTTTAANQPMAAPDRTKMKAVDMSQISADNLQGKRVYGANNEDIGEISDVLVTQDGKVDAFVVDVGGFLGLGEKSVAIGTQNIDFMSNEDGDLVVFTPFTQEQLEASPEYSEQAYQTDRNSTVLMAP